MDGRSEINIVYRMATYYDNTETRANDLENVDEKRYRIHLNYP